MNFKFNKWTFIGATIGFLISLILFPFIFGMVFGLLFFVINAILFGLKIINHPTIGVFFYTGIVSATLIVILATVIGAIWGTKYGKKLLKSK